MLQKHLISRRKAFVDQWPQRSLEDSVDTPSFALILSLGAPVARAATVGYNGEIRENAFCILF